MSTVLELLNVSRMFALPGSLLSRASRKLTGQPSPAVRAVDRVSFQVAKGEVVGVVGESGCGKSTLGRMAARLINPTEGEIRHQGKDLTKESSKEAQRVGLRTQMIFQNPYSSLNPRMRVRDIVGEAPLVHGIVKRNEVDDYVALLLRQVGLDPAYCSRLPHQFSGGQRQRIGIARALAVKPEILICDEAIAALDVSIQAQVINLFMDLQQELNLTYLFISHNLSVVEHICDRILIMYLGRVVESASSEALFKRPLHPYSAALLASAPRLAGGRAQFRAVTGEIPSPLNPPSGCHFHPRCPMARERCSQEAPELREVAPGRASACHFAEELL
jgi:peptide/nickel transport system ATP-binding protein